MSDAVDVAELAAALGEPVDEGEVVDFFGERIHLAEPEDCEFALLEFAEAAGELDTETLAGAAAILRALRASVREDDVERFVALARKNRAQVERDLLPIIVALFERRAARPTRRPSGSSDGPRLASGNSAAGSSSPVIARLERQGRPDLALIVDEAQRARASRVSA